MGSDYSKYEELLNELKNSYTEEEINDKLSSIVKRFSPDVWKEMIYSNPYYKSLFDDIKVEVLEDLGKIKKSILKEIDSIDTDIRGGNVDVKKFIELKVECQLLLMEVEYKIEELELA